MERGLKPVRWIGSSRKDLKTFPDRYNAMWVRLFMQLSAVWNTRPSEPSRVSEGALCLRSWRVEPLFDEFDFSLRCAAKQDYRERQN